MDIGVKSQLHGPHVTKRGECWAFERAAFPTNEEIRYGSELRLRLRECYLRRPQELIGPWCVGVD